MNTTDKSSLYLAIFKRKGGEGIHTKIIKHADDEDCQSWIALLEENEKPLLISFLDMSNWLLLTDNRIITSGGGTVELLYLTDVIEVGPALREEMQCSITDKHKFTRLKIKTRSNTYFTCSLEQGEPYAGVYQVLHFIATCNGNDSKSTVD